MPEVRSTHPSPSSPTSPPPKIAVGIIPARLGSTRFPAKVLADLTGQPLIQHVYNAALRARSLARVVVAADDPRVLRAVQSFHGECILTDPSHPNGTSRLAQAARLLNLPNDQIIVNIQGDEPEAEGDTIDAAVHALLLAESLLPDRVKIATAAAPFPADLPPDAPGGVADPNSVKVVGSLPISTANPRVSRALYFSRSPIPFNRSGAHPAYLRHVGVYVYRRDFLERYAQLHTTPLEAAESLEQLRALEHGYQIALAHVPRAHAGIDTPEQYAAFVERWRMTLHSAPPTCGYSPV